jgi:hypothetical protein
VHLVAEDKCDHAAEDKVPRMSVGSTELIKERRRRLGRRRSGD